MISAHEPLFSPLKNLSNGQSYHRILVGHSLLGRRLLFRPCFKNVDK